jgi:hypothetical protein
MRSTFDLPDELMKQAKIAAVERGVTLRDLVAEGLRRVLAGKPPARRRGKLPNIRIAEDAPVRRMSITDLKALEAEEEAERLDAIYRGR